MSEQEIEKRTEQNKAKEAEQAEEKQESKRSERRRRPKLRIRLIPIWLRLLIIVVLVGGSLLLGLIVGYGVIGDGEPGDALKPETWYHIFDLMKGN